MHPAEGSGRPFLRARPRFVVAGLVAIGLVVVVAGAVLGRWGIGPFANAGGFTRTGSMTTVRLWPTTALLQDGRVLIAGGGGGGVQLASAELYDPKTGTFNPTGSMSEPR
ncbi:MAG: kelch repeat-containing protein, partial [Candidatus Limnocylindrales bacterium]